MTNVSSGYVVQRKGPDGLVALDDCRNWLRPCGTANWPVLMEHGLLARGACPDATSLPDLHCVTADVGDRVNRRKIPEFAGTLTGSRRRPPRPWPHKEADGWLQNETAGLSARLASRSRAAYDSAWRSLRKAAGLDHVFLDGRHTALTRWRKRGNQIGSSEPLTLDVAVGPHHGGRDSSAADRI